MRYGTLALTVSFSLASALFWGWLNGVALRDALATGRLYLSGAGAGGELEASTFIALHVVAGLPAVLGLGLSGFRRSCSALVWILSWLLMPVFALVSGSVVAAVFVASLTGRLASLALAFAVPVAAAPHLVALALLSLPFVVAVRLFLVSLLWPADERRRPAVAGRQVADARTGRPAVAGGAGMPWGVMAVAALLFFLPGAVLFAFSTGYAQLLLRTAQSAAPKPESVVPALSGLLQGVWPNAQTGGTTPAATAAMAPAVARARSTPDAGGAPTAMPSPVPASPQATRTPSPPPPEPTATPTVVPAAEPTVGKEQVATAIRRGVAYLASQYDRQAGLIREAPVVAPNRYWLYNDNAVAVYVLNALREEDLAGRVWSGMTKFQSESNSPVRVLWGEAVSWPPGGAEYRLVQTVGPAEVWMESSLSAGLFHDWREYGNLAVLGALNEYNRGNTTAAKATYGLALRMFDGEGIRDKAVAGAYETYKVALALHAGAYLGELSRGDATRLAEVLLRQQADSGGFYSHYPNAGDPHRDGIDTNAETTSLAVLALHTYRAKYDR